MSFVIPIEISARHIHISVVDRELLFGKGSTLTVLRELSQHGQFAAKETLTVHGPQGVFPRLRIVGPEREQTQIEFSKTDSKILGLQHVPLRISGDLSGAMSVTLSGTTGVTLERSAVIVAWRHIHTNPVDAARMGISHGQFVRVLIRGDRSVVFNQVAVRVHEQFDTRLHLDTDEGNACGFVFGITAELLH